MARSKKIYTVIISEENEVNGYFNYASYPIACFTVKHEMITWLKKRPQFWDCCYIYAMKDNPYEVKDMDSGVALGTARRVLEKGIR